MKIIAAVDSNWGIGVQGQLLVNIPEDMKFFRETTLNKVVIMGRITLESFPNKSPLKNRLNIVITHDRDYSLQGAIIVHSKEELLSEIKKYDTEDVFVIGGDSVYKMLFPYCKKAFITMIDADGGADKYMINLSEMLQ